MSEPLMIPMSRVRHVLETFGDCDEVPWGIFLVIPVDERPLTQADIDRAREVQVLILEPDAPAVSS